MNSPDPTRSPNPPGTPEGVAIAPGVVVPQEVLRFAYSRSSGPGGQNVNKVASKAELRVSIDQLPVRGRVISRLRIIAGRRIIGAVETTILGADGIERRAVRGGELIIVSQEHRSQSQNREECLARLRELLVAALAEPKIRRKTKPSRGSVERRLDAKKRRSDTKRRRGDGHD